MKSTPFCKF